MTEQPPRSPRLSRLRAGRPLPAPIEALRALDARTRPNLKRAIPAVLVALVSFGFGDHLGGIPRTHDTTFAMFGWSLSLTKGQVSILVLGLSVLFVVAGVIATRSVAGELGRVSEVHGGVAAASAIRLICMVLGYGFVGLAVLALLRVELGNLLVGGAVTGVIVGIAAQQTLGNVFAGLVLLFARPYVPGQRVKIRSGSMGGPFDGVIVTAGLMYTTIDTEEGLVSMPNSGLLAAAIGPSDGTSSEEEEPGGTLASGDPGTGPGGNPAIGQGGNPA
ncbi:mechanosensitive ion channel domain-containing protein [Jatrophihabitans sp.]|uniref:mechanosensitive ion channel domain-containing protein n=1 Tax=Jatrophihabitans sp. TaxID=1932789 RepID=UPI002CF673AA|nr:mechanosensitive ion channel family protein [Jatrophihabitans sp.]